MLDPIFSARLPAELVDDVLEVVFRSIGIVGLDGRLVMLVDQFLEPGLAVSPWCWCWHGRLPGNLNHR